ncbi:MAG TPA: sigma-70 family RNA polymerase sigma factor [Solirubrobacteraceae bacterium]|nr:sigma-70 family RNA polymerase sigma factor [Solirubrobacteraceae bacterium]
MDDPRRIGFDEAALERFYRAHVELVERFVARRVGDPHLVADLTADVFLAAIDAAPSYDSRRGPPSAWLVGIARNVVSSEFRRVARERRARGRINARELLDADDVVRLQERIDAEGRARRLLDALEALPAGEREVFELVAVDELTPREAASVLGISAVAARVRLHRARAAMRNAIAPDAPTVNQPVEA